MKKFTLLVVLLFLFLIGAVNAQRKLSGTVTSSQDNKPVIGATVAVKGTTIGALTDVNGKFEIMVPEKEKTLVVSFVGLKTQDITIGTSNEINVALQPDILKLNTLVVTAIGISRETKALGYSVQDVNGTDIAQSHTDNVLNALTGKIAGVDVVNSSGAAGGASYITIRGPSSIQGDEQPLFVVDGVPIDNSMNISDNPDNGITNNNIAGVAWSNRGIDINPEDIESISVLKGGAASALYGLRGANGVVVITTKKGKPTVGGQKFSVNYSFNVSFESINKFPGMQDKYVQGSAGVWKGAETATRTSWGPAFSDVMYAAGPLKGSQDPYNLGYYNWDKNGIIVMKNNPDYAAGGKYANIAHGGAVTPYDNVKNFFQTGTTYNNALSIMGGNSDAVYYFSLSNEKNNSIIPNNEFHKTTFKVSGESKFSSKFSTSGSINYINSGGTRLQQGSNLSGIMLGLLRTPPSFDNAGGYSDPVNSPGAYSFPDGSQRSFRGYGIYDNPFWSVNKNLFKDDVNRLIGSASFNYLPFDWLTVIYRIGNDFYQDKRNGHIAIGSGVATNGQIQLDNYFNMDINSDLIVNIRKEITKDIKTDITLGNNIYQHKNDRTFVQGDNLTLPDFYNITNASSVISRSLLDRKRTAAFYGDFGFSYKSMVFVNFTGRNEWSTTLPVDKNSFFFPSVSGGFVFTELEALKNKIMPFGKIRVSYAVIANDAFEYATATPFTNSVYADGWTTGISFPFNGASGFTRGATLGNPNLKPERAKSFEIGADLRFWENRGRLDISYYNKKSEDLIIQVPVAASTGYNYEWLNAASMSNKGIELSLTGVPVKLKDFEWDITFNYTSNVNKVLSLAPGVPNVYLGGFTDPQMRAVVGESYGTIYGYAFEKDSKGNVIIDDATGYPIAVASNQTAMGSTLPKFTIGLNNEFRYKDFYLSFLFDFRKGAKMWNGTQGILESLGTAANTENRGTSTVFSGVLGHYDDNGNLVINKDGNGNEIANTRTAVLDQGWYGGLGGGFGGEDETRVQKTDWVRLRQVTIGYTLNQNIVKKTGFKSIEVYITGKNLWLKTPYQGVDPETNLFGAFNAQGFDYFNMPNTKSVVIGLRVSI